VREIRFYRSSSGNCPVEEFLDSLSGKQAQKVVWVLRLVEELETIPRQYFKKLTGSPEGAGRITCKGVQGMSDLKEYVRQRSQGDPEFAEGFETGYEDFKIGVLLRQAREQAGFTQQEIAEKLETQKSAISRIENRAGDIRLSTLERYAQALGWSLSVQLNPPRRVPEART
jgi:DNA-binding XRE family transcriptional regulator